MIPAGKYKAYAIQGEFGKSKNKGTDFVAIEFEIMDGDHKGDRITWWGYFTEATSGRTVEAMQFAGCTFPDDQITNLEGLGTTEVQIVVEHETYENKTRAKVAWVNAPNGGGPQIAAMPAAEKSAFAQKMRGLVQMKKKTLPAASSGGGASNGAGDDQIPW